MLHITNGDSAADSLRATGLGGTVLPWRDVLHEGPVPADLPLQELSAVRAQFLADVGLAESAAHTRQQFQDRDAALLAATEHEEVCLWFEHDLYDQLQIIQILSELASLPMGTTQVTLLCINEHPGVPRFLGLGQLSPQQLAALWPQREPVLDSHYEAARVMWRAFRSPDPVQLLEATHEGLSGLPYLRPAIARFLQEYPNTQQGLGRTEATALEAISQGVQEQRRLFLHVNNAEQAPFLGDSTFFARLAMLQREPAPLLAGSEPLALTEHGSAVLHGEADAVQLQGIDRWFGGVHLTDAQPVWRWDDALQTLVHPITGPSVRLPYL